ncbi:MAG TPA: hypothetical protein VF582_01485 [Allosphingosinicella sp.]
MTDDPVVRRLLRFAAGFRPGGKRSEHDVLATYVTTDGREAFAFCRHGLLIDPSGEERFIPFADVDEEKLLTVDELMAAKDGSIPPEHRRLSLPLRSGDTLDLRVDGRTENNCSDIIGIAGLIRQRAIQDRWQPS